MSVKIPLIEMQEGDYVTIRLMGNAESAIAIRAHNSSIHIVGPKNQNKKQFLFSVDGVEEIRETETLAKAQLEE